MQFVVPQFIDNEDKILGPITIRQFLIMLVVGFIDFIMYKLLDFALFLIIGIPLSGIGLVIAFVRINSQPFHLFLLNLIQTVKRPGRRVWNKVLSENDLRAYLVAPPPPPPPPAKRKEFISRSRLSELTLLVNTGGVYRPEE
jgi:hypothetical protein